jgi:NAD-dependent DNA ligase
MRIVKECLDAIGVTSADFEGCGSLEDEFNSIKKVYRQKVLACHPDKGGDAAEFREVRTSFEEMRRMYTANAVDSFATEQAAEASTYEKTYQDFGDMPTPSWEFFYTAAEEDVPLYRVEGAKSGRSKCVQKGKAKSCGSGEEQKIPKGDVRIGSIDKDSGSHGRWVHLNCWRVPSKVWLGVPDPKECDDPKMFEQALLAMNEVLLSGVSELSPENKQAFVEYVMDKEHWAKLIKRKPKNKEDGDEALTEVEKQEKKAVVIHGKHKPSQVFVVPVPGKNGAMENMLEGKRVVLTGTFPEVGGGASLNLGKEKVKRMVEAFGGKVTGSVSGKTDILIVGKDPGFSKVSQSKSKGIQLIALKDLKEAIEGGRLEDAPQPGAITNFSGGYGGKNSLALGASDEALAFASGVQAPQIKAAPMKRPAGEVNNKSTKKKPKKQKKQKASKSLDASAKVFVPGK